MKIFVKYLAEHIKYIIMFLLFFTVFAITFALYGLPLSAVIYPFCICFVVLCGFLIFDFLKERKKHNELVRLVNNIEVLADNLPETENILEEDYQQLIFELKKRFNEFKTENNEKYSDMINYYTVWAHQIKTPIASMELYLQNEDSSLARKIRNDLFRIEQYVEMVMAYLRLGSDETDYLFRKVDLNSVLTESIKKFSTEFIERRLKLEYDITEYSFITDEKWFAFCIEQVLSNALKYTKEGTVKMYMKNENTLCIEDSGMGIAKEDLPRIFEKGYTGTIGRFDKKASGLGLYLCKNVCNKLGIKLYAESTVDVGTKMFFELKTKNKI